MLRTMSKYKPADERMAVVPAAELRELRSKEKRIAELEGELGAITKHFEIVSIERDVLREYHEACYQLLGKPEGFNLVDEVTALIEERTANVSLREALGPIVEFCDDPDGSEKGESLACGLARLLPAARTALTQPAEALERVRGEAKVEMFDEIRERYYNMDSQPFNDWLELKAAALRGGQ